MTEIQRITRLMNNEKPTNLDKTEEMNAFLNHIAY